MCRSLISDLTVSTLESEITDKHTHEMKQLSYACNIATFYSAIYFEDVPSFFNTTLEILILSFVYKGGKTSKGKEACYVNCVLFHVKYGVFKQTFF